MAQERAASSPVDILTEIAIERPHAEVAAYAGDPDKAPQWYVNIKSVEWVTRPPVRVGSKLAFVAHFLGRRLGTRTRSSSWSWVNAW